jgi:P27 family predicted phage terminase small subunit
MEGRKPTPTHLKLIRGTTRRDRSNPKEAKIDASFGKPEPPAHLSPEGREEWDKQCDLLFKIGLLTMIDAPVFAAYCQAYGRWRRAEEQLSTQTSFLVRTKVGNFIQHPLVGTANKAMHDMVRYAVELGLTPSARTRIHAEPSANDPATKYLS